MTGDGSERRPAGAAFAIAAFLVVFGGVLIRDAYRVPNKAGYAGIGAGDIPWLIGVALVILGALTALSGLRGRFEAEAPPQRIGPVLWILGGLAAQLVLVHGAGFVIATAILFVCAAAGFGEKRFHLSVPFGFVLALAVYGVFDGLLKLNLPGGPLERAIFGG